MCDRKESVRKDGVRARDGEQMKSDGRWGEIKQQGESFVGSKAFL